MTLVFWMLSFKPTFSLSSFTFIKNFLSSSSLSAIRVVSSAYLRLFLFLPAILIPACASSSPAILMMYSACKLNKQGDNIQPWCTLFLFGAFMKNHFSRVYAETTYHLQKSFLSLSYTCSGRDTSTISKFTFKLFCHSLTSARNLIPQTFAFVVTLVNSSLPSAYQFSSIHKHIWYTVHWKCFSLTFVSSLVTVLCIFFPS